MRYAVYICKVKRELPFPVSLWHFLEVFSLCVCAARGALVNIIIFLFFLNFFLRYFDKEYDLDESNKHWASCGIAMNL